MAKKIEKEIEEVLQGLDDFVPEGPSTARPADDSVPARPSSQRMSRRLASISLNQVMLWSLSTVIVAFFLRGVPGASWIMLASILVFAASFALSLASGTAPPPAPRQTTAQPVRRPAPAWLKNLKVLLRGR